MNHALRTLFVLTLALGCGRSSKNTEHVDASAAPTALATTSSTVPASAASSGEHASATGTGAVKAEPAQGPEKALRFPARAPLPAGAAKWSTKAEASNGFYPILDGLCSDLAVYPLGSDALISYGGTASEMYIDGVRKGAASFVGLHRTSLLTMDLPKINAPTGIAGTSLDAFWLGSGTGSRSGDGKTMHRQENGTWVIDDNSDDVDFHAWVDGGLIANKGMVTMNGRLKVRGTKTEPPEALYAGFPLLTRLSAFPTGEVILVGRVDQQGELQARHWSPGKTVATRSLQKFFSPDDVPWFKEITPSEVYAYEGKSIVRWDGTSWRALAKAKHEFKNLYRMAEDDLWSVLPDGSIEHITATSAAPLASTEKIRMVRGHDRGDIWAISKSDKLLHREGETWVEKSTPAPVFTSSKPAFRLLSLEVLAPNDVLLIGRYWEKAPGWKDQELRYALFRSREMPETYRCNEPDPENNRIEVGMGFQSWPRPATDACTSPFVVLARRSNTHKVTDDWPKLRAAFKGQSASLAAQGENIELREFVSGNRTFVGVMAKDFLTAQQIVTLATKANTLRPEIVCGDPEATRTLSLNLATGSATVK